MAKRGRLNMVLVTVLAGALALAACSSCGTKRFPAETEKKLNKLLAMMMEQNGIPGAVAGAWVPGEGTWTTAAGKADTKTGSSEAEDLRFRAGSITKTFVATVILQLVDEQKLGLDDTLDEYIDGFQYGDRITIRQLLNHTSGVYGYDDSPGFTEETVQHPERRWTTGEMLDLARSGQPYFAPGEHWRYCNTNYLLLGLIVEEVTGGDIAEEVRLRIVERLGLAATFFPDSASMGGPHSHGYVAWDGRFGMPDTDTPSDVTNMNPSWAWAAGAIVSDLDDLHRWAKALATGELISPEMHKEQLRWVNIPGAEAIGGKYGLGVYSMGGMVGHDGMLWGYNCGMYYYPEKDATIVVLFNRGMDQRDGEWVSPDIPFTMAASAVLFPGRMPWDQE
ncbi:MAG: beta-lactamase family protein [Actinobacteria bacterium]|nr:beta-lactamase family protein [Actinomycetota bacterium]MBU2686948.1 beta-lactamase family protein [Actinomycetota bacterium]